MKRLTLLFTLIMIACIVQAQESNVVPGEFIVQLRPETNIENVKANLGGRMEVEALSEPMGIYLLKYFGNLADPIFLSKLGAEPGIKIAQYNHYVQQRSTSPDDPLFGQQDALENLGGTSAIPDADIDAPEAWDLTTGGLTAYGDTIVIAVIDGRFDLNHEDLDFFVNRHEIPGNGFDDDGNGYIDDYLGWNAYNTNDDVGTSSTVFKHGSHVAGIAGAKGNNATGISGVNWNVKILPIVGSTTTEAVAVAAYAYTVEMRRLYNQTAGTKGAFIVVANSSFGVDGGNPASYPIWCAMYDSMGAQGILSVGATANSKVNVDAEGDIPTACVSEFLVSVTNTTKSDNLSLFAGYGKNSIDLGAPGTGVLSTTTGDNYEKDTGTSMSAPHVAGAIALMYSYACSTFMDDYYTNPANASLQVKEYLLAGVDEIPALNGITVTNGRLNLFNAVRLMNTYNCNNCTHGISLAVQDETCAGDTDGSAVVSGIGGSGSYSYSWSDGSSLSNRSGLAPGWYEVTVTDNSNSCQQVALLDINEAFPIELTELTVNDKTTSGPGSIILDAEGGSSGLYYQLSTGAGSSFGYFGGLGGGTYTVTILDSLGCSIDTTVTITDFTAVGPEPEAGISIYPNPTNDAITIELKRIEQFGYQLYNAAGQQIDASQIPLSGAQLQQLSLKALPNGVYLLVVSDTEGNTYLQRISKL